MIFEWFYVTNSRNLEGTAVEIKKKEICKCENCGNEAEMVVTCTLPYFNDGEAGAGSSSEPSAEKTGKKVKGTATCTQCGNEADMWIDL